jgi:hypothetical protein
MQNIPFVAVLLADYDGDDYYLNLLHVSSKEEHNSLKADGSFSLIKYAIPLLSSKIASSCSLLDLKTCCGLIFKRS